MCMAGYVGTGVCLHVKKLEGIKERNGSSSGLGLQVLERHIIFPGETQQGSALREVPPRQRGAKGG